MFLWPLSLHELFLVVPFIGIERMSTNSEKLNKWAILCIQDPMFLESVKIAYVYDQGNQVMLVTRDDDVYAIGVCTCACVCLL